MDLRGWITAEHDAVLARFEQSVASAVPQDRWTDAVGPGGSSIAWLAFHTTYHADLAVNAVLRGDGPLLATWRDDLGLGNVPAAVGLGEAEQPELTAALDLDRLVPYVRAVHAGAADWLAGLDVDTLGDTGGADRPASNGPASTSPRSRGSTPCGRASRRRGSSSGRPSATASTTSARWSSVRNRLGLSPF